MTRAYKSCENYIVELELPSSAALNINAFRGISANRNYVKFKCDKAKVIRIFSKDDENEIEYLRDKNDNFLYIKGNSVGNENNIPIYFFLSKERAFFHDKHIENGTCKKWHENGQIFKQYTVVNGKKHGKYKEWRENGQIFEESEYVNDQLNGIKKTWNQRDESYSEYTYLNDNLHGKYKPWHQIFIFTTAITNKMLCALKNFSFFGKRSQYETL